MPHRARGRAGLNQAEKEPRHGCRRVGAQILRRLPLERSARQPFANATPARPENRGRANTLISFPYGNVAAWLEASFLLGSLGRSHEAKGHGPVWPLKNIALADFRSAVS